VAGGGAVVPHEEVVAFRDEPAPALVVAPGGLDVGLVQRLAVDEDVAVPLDDGVAGKPDQALDERPARAATLRRGQARLRRRVEDDDLAPVRRAEVVDEAVREHPVREAGEAAWAGPGAVERR